MYAYRTHLHRSGSKIACVGDPVAALPVEGCGDRHVPRSKLVKA